MLKDSKIKKAWELLNLSNISGSASPSTQISNNNPRHIIYSLELIDIYNSAQAFKILICPSSKAFHFREDKGLLQRHVFI